MATDETPPAVVPGLTILGEMDAWRAAHPTATLVEIEAALDAQLAALRRQMLQDTVAKSPQADWSSRPDEERPTCPECGVPLKPRGNRARQLRSAGGEITFTRTYGICPVCKQGVFPPR